MPALLQAHGRPQTFARFQLAELPVVMALLATSIQYMGALGAAIASSTLDGQTEVSASPYVKGGLGFAIMLTPNLGGTLELGAAWAGGYDGRAPAPLDAAITFAPSGDVVVAALRALDRGGIVAINAIHLDRVPEFPYELLWWERQLRSVANFTRDDAREFLDLAAAINLQTTIDTFPLSAANEALAWLKAGTLEGTAVLVP